MSSKYSLIIAILFLLIQTIGSGQIIPKQILPTGDVKYGSKNDPNVIAQGSYSHTKFKQLLKQNGQTQNAAKLGGGTLQIQPGLYRLKSVDSGLHIQDNNFFLRGSGIGLSSLHFEASNNIEEFALRYKAPAGNKDQLIRGGGIENLTIKTDNKYILNYGIQLDYIEYFQLNNVAIENFGKSALMGCFWESNVNNLILRSSGALQTINPENSYPENGVLDFDSHSISKYRDACNNTNFSKLTFSSCFGTHIRCDAFANTNVNINIFGLYDETYPGDGGQVDNYPIYFFKGVKNFNVVGGFLTVNPTNIHRSGYAVYVANDSRNGHISFTNFEFLMNHSSSKFLTNSFQRLKSFIYIEQNQSIHLMNVTISDPSGSVGISEKAKHLIDGKSGSQLFLNNVTFLVKKGVWNAGNIISSNIKCIGNIILRYYDDNGPTNEVSFYQFN